MCGLDWAEGPWKRTEDKAQDGKRVEGRMERKPREVLWFIGQDDGPCRPEQDLNGSKDSFQMCCARAWSLTKADA